jgi:multidrug efflux pump subunit AcrB
MGAIFAQLPSGFLPDEDQGIMAAQVTLPTGATMEQTLATIGVRKHFQTNEKDNVSMVFSVGGFSFNGQARMSASSSFA